MPDLADTDSAPLSAGTGHVPQDRDRPARNAQYGAGGRVEAARTLGGLSGRIPEQHFQEHFGKEHYFRFHRPVVVDHRSRFRSGGYWFELIDPLPVGWGYDEFDVDYVDDQYYLYDPVHPGMRIVVNVVLSTKYLKPSKFRDSKPQKLARPRAPYISAYRFPSVLPK